MSEKYWWTEFGCFQPWKQCPSRPDPAEVILFYLEKQNIEPEKYVTYLMDKLNLQKSMVYNILKGDALDSISRCRELVEDLKIYPPLLGIDAMYYPIEQHPYWWKTYAFPFNADALGYPVMSEVVAYLRMKRMQIGEGGRVKTWSQEDLGIAAGLKKETVYRMEHEFNPHILESMHRRSIVAAALGILEGANESTIFRLFGLAPQAYRVPVPECEAVPVIQLSTQQLTDEMLTECQEQLAAFFEDYCTGQDQEDARDVICEWVKQFGALMPLASTTARRIDVLALQSRSHRLLACMAQEQCEKKRVLFHTAKAVDLAEQAMTLPNPKWGSDHPKTLIANELLASAVLTMAMASYELGKLDLAQEQIERALNMLPSLKSRQLRMEILGVAALIRAATATSSMEQQMALSYINSAATMNVPGQSSEAFAPDENFFWCSEGGLALYKAEVLGSANMRGATGERVLDVLADAQRLIDATMVRQWTRFEILLAEAYFAERDYMQATEMALLALEKCWPLRSRLSRDRVERVYLRLLGTAFGGKPQVVGLGVRLRRWDCGVG